MENPRVIPEEPKFVVPTFDVAALISNGLRKVPPSNPRSRANIPFCRQEEGGLITGLETGRIL
jgi:hypothetical protein